MLNNRKAESAEMLDLGGFRFISSCLNSFWSYAPFPFILTYSICLSWRETAPEWDAPTTMLHSGYGVVWKMIRLLLCAEHNVSFTITPQKGSASFYLMVWGDVDGLGCFVFCELVSVWKEFHLATSPQIPDMWWILKLVVTCREWLVLARCSSSSCECCSLSTCWK